jgi:DNA repair protein RecO (recombination protein O)
MALYRTRAVVVSRRALGEQDRLVEFYSRDHGKVRGVAKSARRPRSRFVAALEPLTLGELVFFDTGRRELVRVDHFDIVRPFVAVREDLGRLGRGAWMCETLSRLSADRDPHPALFGLLVRSLRGLEGAVAPDRVALCFAARALDLLGHRPRLDRCLECGRVFPFPGAALDTEAGGLVCGACGAGDQALPISGPAVITLARLRALRWEESLALGLRAEIERELGAALDTVLARLIGAPSRSLRFLGQTRRGLAGVAEPPPAPRRT